MTKTKPEQILCDVCPSNKPAIVYSSGIGPVSYAYCKRCVEMEAEPLSGLFLTIYLQGGIEKIGYLGKSSWHKGHYIDWDGIKKIYPDLIDGHRLYMDRKAKSWGGTIDDEVYENYKD